MPALSATHRIAIANSYASSSLLPDQNGPPPPLSPRLGSSSLATLSHLRRSIAHATNDILSRQVNGILPTYYKVDGPSPGTVVGILLGSVAGFLFLCWLFFAMGNPMRAFASTGDEEIVVRRRDNRSPHSRRSRRSSGTEVREASRSPRRERIIIDSHRGPPRRSRSIVVEERVEHRVPGDDIVEVFEGSTSMSEATTPPPRRQNRRGGGYRY